MTLLSVSVCKRILNVCLSIVLDAQLYWVALSPTHRSWGGDPLSGYRSAAHIYSDDKYVSKLIISDYVIEWKKERVPRA